MTRTARTLNLASRFALVTALFAQAVLAAEPSLEELDSAKLILLLTSDGKINVCPRISKDEALVLLGTIHPLYDQALKTAHPSANAVKNCAKDCHCSAYGEALWSEELQKKGTAQSDAALAGCAKRHRSFCRSRLLTKLRQDAE